MHRRGSNFNVFKTKSSLTQKFAEFSGSLKNWKFDCCIFDLSCPLRFFEDSTGWKWVKRHTYDFVNCNRRSLWTLQILLLVSLACLMISTTGTHQPWLTFNSCTQPPFPPPWPWSGKTTYATQRKVWHTWLRAKGVDAEIYCTPGNGLSRKNLSAAGESFSILGQVLAI